MKPTRTYNTSVMYSEVYAMHGDTSSRTCQRESQRDDSYVCFNVALNDLMEKVELSRSIIAVAKCE
jgi:hypothetical protein